MRGASGQVKGDRDIQTFVFKSPDGEAEINISAAYDLHLPEILPTDLLELAFEKDGGVFRERRAEHRHRVAYRWSEAVAPAPVCVAPGYRRTADSTTGGVSASTSAPQLPALGRGRSARFHRWQLLE